MRTFYDELEMKPFTRDPVLMESIRKYENRYDIEPGSLAYYAIEILSNPEERE